MQQVPPTNLIFLPCYTMEFGLAIRPGSWLGFSVGWFPTYKRCQKPMKQESVGRCLELWSSPAWNAKVSSFFDPVGFQHQVSWARSMSNAPRIMCQKNMDLSSQTLNKSWKKTHVDLLRHVPWRVERNFPGYGSFLKLTDIPNRVVYQHPPGRMPWLQIIYAHILGDESLTLGKPRNFEQGVAALPTTTSNTWFSLPFGKHGGPMLFAEKDKLQLVELTICHPSPKWLKERRVYLRWLLYTIIVHSSLVHTGMICMYKSMWYVVCVFMIIYLVYVGMKVCRYAGMQVCRYCFGIM